LERVIPGSLYKALRILSHTHKALKHGCLESVLFHDKQI